MFSYLTYEMSIQRIENNMITFSNIALGMNSLGA